MPFLLAAWALKHPVAFLTQSEQTTDMPKAPLHRTGGMQRSGTGRESSGQSRSDDSRVVQRSGTEWSGSQMVPLLIRSFVH